MSNDAKNTIESTGNGGFSRRAALKAGAAAGVGAVAWSGVSITSMGGTPAYAAGCTGFIRINLGADCRNTDQASACSPVRFRYHVISSPTWPTGYPAGSWALNLTFNSGACCIDGVAGSLTFPNGLACEIRIEMFEKQNCGPSGKMQWFLQVGPVDSPAVGNGTLPFTLGCPTSLDYVSPYTYPNMESDSFYSMFIACTTKGGNPNNC